jgi:hypothetical protein
MKFIIRSLLALTLALSSGCAMSSTYNHYQRTKPAAVQTKARSLGALQIRAAADGESQQILAGVDLTKINVGFFEVLAEEPVESAKAIGWDALKAAAIAYGLKYANDQLDLVNFGGSSKNDEPAYTGPVINANNGGNIQVNGAPADSYKNHNLNANGPNSSINLNFVEPEEKNSDAPFNTDGTPNLDGQI